MRDPIPTSQVAEGAGPMGEAAHIEVVVRNDGRVTLTSTAAAGMPVFFSPEQIAQLRNQLGDVLTIALRDARTGRGCTAS